MSMKWMKWVKWRDVRQFLIAGAITGVLSLAMYLARSWYEYKTAPVGWQKFTKVEGQPLPVPDEWLVQPEARFAHSLKLPASVPEPKPFDFRAAAIKSFWPGIGPVSYQYFQHLCKSEAGKWIFRKVENVEGFYFARPEKRVGGEVMMDPFGPEMPWIQRLFFRYGESAREQGWLFIQPPFYNYLYVEQPHRDLFWQKNIRTAYVRLFGYDDRKDLPMRADALSEHVAEYGYTWRGIRRERDREFNIAGGELLIYSLRTQEILAVERQFLRTGKNARGKERAVWELAASCPQLPGYAADDEITQFALDVLQTIDPSYTGTKK